MGEAAAGGEGWMREREREREKKKKLGQHARSFLSGSTFSLFRAKF